MTIEKIVNQNLTRRRLLELGGGIVLGSILPKIGLAQISEKVGPEISRSKFGRLRDFNEHIQRQQKPGVDFDIKDETAIYPLAPGRISEISENVTWGKYITIDHGDTVTFYGCLRDVANLQVNDKVERTTPLGVAGALTSHSQLGFIDRILHISARIKTSKANGDSYRYSDGKHYIDPIGYSFDKAKDPTGIPTLAYWDGKGTEMFSAPFRGKGTEELYRISKP